MHETAGPEGRPPPTSAVVLPGRGYPVDGPLLFFAQVALRRRGIDVTAIRWSPPPDLDAAHAPVHRSRSPRPPGESASVWAPRRGGGSRQQAGVSLSRIGLATWRLTVPRASSSISTTGASPNRSAHANACATSLIGPAGTPAADRIVNHSSAPRRASA